MFKLKRLYYALSLLLTGLCFIPQFINAQQEYPKILTLERIYKNDEFKEKKFGPARWLKDGSGYTTLQNSEDFPGAKDIIKHNPETGQSLVLVNARNLVAEYLLILPGFGVIIPGEITGCLIWNPSN